MILLLVGCAQDTTPPTNRYVDALRAATFEQAWAMCAELPPGGRGDCQQVSATRFERFDACDQVEAGVWHEECLFTAAEARVVAADRPGALDGCSRSRYVSNCEQHVLEAMASEYRYGTPQALADAWTAIAPLTHGENSQIDLWRSWHRMRIQEGVPFEECPNRACRTAQQAEVISRTRDLVRHQGCENVEILLEWEPGSEAARWAESAVKQRCRRVP